MLHVKDAAMLQKTLTTNYTNNTLTMIKFTASWCRPCKKIQPFVERVGATFAPLLEVCVVDVDAAPALSEHFKISAMPTFVFVVKNDVVETVTGADEAKLLEVIVKLTGETNK